MQVGRVLILLLQHALPASLTGILPHLVYLSFIRLLKLVIFENTDVQPSEEKYMSAGFKAPHPNITIS